MGDKRIKQHMMGHVTLRNKFCLNTRKRKAPLKTTTAMRDIKCAQASPSAAAVRKQAAMPVAAPERWAENLLGLRNPTSLEVHFPPPPGSSRSPSSSASSHASSASSLSAASSSDANHNPFSCSAFAAGVRGVRSCEKNSELLFPITSISMQPQRFRWNVEAGSKFVLEQICLNRYPIHRLAKQMKPSFGTFFSNIRTPISHPPGSNVRPSCNCKNWGEGGTNWSQETIQQMGKH